MVNKVIDGLTSEVNEICKRHLGLESNIIDASPSILNTSDSIIHESKNFQNVKGIKKKYGVRRGKCPKSWVEK